MAVSSGAAAAGAGLAAMYGLTGLVLAFWAFILLLIGISLIIVLWALYSILTAENKGEWKLLWALVVIFAGWIGVVLYYFIGRKERIKK